MNMMERNRKIMPPRKQTNNEQLGRFRSRSRIPSVLPKLRSGRCVILHLGQESSRLQSTLLVIAPLGHHCVQRTFSFSRDRKLRLFAATMDDEFKQRSNSNSSAIINPVALELMRRGRIPQYWRCGMVLEFEREQDDATTTRSTILVGGLSVSILILAVIQRLVL